MKIGEIKAEFIFDTKGRLIGIREIDIIHYCICLSLNNLLVNPEKVIYELDESYFNSKIEVKAGVTNFRTEITTYGDYEIKARIYYENKIEIICANLSEILAKVYQSNNSLEITEALEQIRRL